MTAADIGAIIRARRRKLGLGQAALAKRVGVGREWIVDVEQGKPRAGSSWISTFCAAFVLKEN